MNLNVLEKPTADLFLALAETGLLQDFQLVGGTALALQIGHRISIDLDFFTNKSFDEQLLLDQLREQFTVELFGEAPNSLNLVINDIKVDILRHNYRQLNMATPFEGLQVASLDDIAAMKINAICKRGGRKDFVDIYFLLRYFTISKMIDLFVLKYPHSSELMALKSLVYFKEAEEDLEPVMIEKVSWAQVKETISKAVRKLEI